MLDSLVVECSMKNSQKLKKMARLFAAASAHRGLAENSKEQASILLGRCKVGGLADLEVIETLIQAAHFAAESEKAEKAENAAIRKMGRIKVRL